MGWNISINLLDINNNVLVAEDFTNTKRTPVAIPLSIKLREMERIHRDLDWKKVNITIEKVE